MIALVILRLNLTDCVRIRFCPLDLRSSANGCRSVPTYPNIPVGMRAANFQFCTGNGNYHIFFTSSGFINFVFSNQLLVF